MRFSRQWRGVALKTGTVYCKEGEGYVVLGPFLQWLSGHSREQPPCPLFLGGLKPLCRLYTFSRKTHGTIEVYLFSAKMVSG